MVMEWNTYCLPQYDEVLFYRNIMCVNKFIRAKELVKLAKELDIDLKFVPMDTSISPKFSYGKIELTSGPKGRKETFHFVRHLRNAFCHLNICVEGEECYLHDNIPEGLKKKNNQITMTGWVKYDNLKTLISKLSK